MNNSKKHLLKLISDFAKIDGYHETPIKGVICIKNSQSTKREKRHWRSCFGIIVQGSKEVVLDNSVFKAREFYYTATPVDLPVISRFADATKEKPFLSILIDFNSSILSELTLELDKISKHDISIPVKPMFVGIAEEKMIEGFVRLAELFKKPDDAKILGPVIIKELFFHLLKSSNGQEIRQFVRSGSALQKIAKAIFKLKSELDQEINVPDLIKTATMSRSVFFKQFKEATSMSPIQYQKHLRLLEARRLMIEANETAEGAAFKVGYNSASQFSREYTRMFGDSPHRDVAKIKVVSSGVSF
jgi:AraC-like DNA-binding protein